MGRFGGNEACGGDWHLHDGDFDLALFGAIGILILPIIDDAELGRNEVNAATDLSLYGKKPDASINVAMRWHLRQEDGRRRFIVEKEI